MLTALLTTRHIYARTYLLARPYPYTHRRASWSLQAVRGTSAAWLLARWWRRRPLCSHSGWRSSAKLELNQTALSSVAPASARTRGVPIRYTRRTFPTHMHTCDHMRTCDHMHTCGHGSPRAPAYRCGRSYVKRAISRRFVFGGLNKEAMIGTGKTTPNRLWWRCFPAYIALLDRL